MTRRVVVLMNAGSGTGHDEALVRRVSALFAQAGIEAQVQLAQGAALADALKAAVAQQPDIVVAAGGDGTVSAVGGALAGTAIALGVLPLGTLNHFAKYMKLPLTLEAAVAAIAQGATTHDDVGEVNGRVFLNNSSLGLYRDVVRDRERQQKRLGRGKWLALLWASLVALRRLGFMSVRLSVDGQLWRRRTPFVFIGNNAYTMEGFAIGERAALDGGCLSLYVAQRPGRLRLLQLALFGLLGRLRQARDFDALLAPEIVVDSGHHQLRVAVDGEVTVMQTPLHYRIRPRDLRVAGVGPAPGATV